jgi:hypothetical protein
VNFPIYPLTLEIFFHTSFRGTNRNSKNSTLLHERRFEPPTPCLGVYTSTTPAQASHNNMCAKHNIYKLLVANHTHLPTSLLYLFINLFYFTTSFFFNLIHFDFCFFVSILLLHAPFTYFKKYSFIKISNSFFFNLIHFDFFFFVSIFLLHAPFTYFKKYSFIKISNYMSIIRL